MLLQNGIGKIFLLPNYGLCATLEFDDDATVRALVVIQHGLVYQNGLGPRSAHRGVSVQSSGSGLSSSSGICQGRCRNTGCLRRPFANGACFWLQSWSETYGRMASRHLR